MSMVSKIKSGLKNLTSMQFVIELIVNISVGIIVYYVITAYFFKPSVPEEQVFYGAAHVLQERPAFENDKVSKIYVRTDKMDVVIDRASGAISQVMLRQFKDGDALYQTLPTTQSTSMAANMSLVPESVVYKSAKSSYYLGDDDSLTVRLTANSEGVKYHKNLTFKKGSYEIGVDAGVQNNTQRDVVISPRFDIVGRRQADSSSGPISLKSFSIHEQTTAGVPLGRLYEGFSNTGAKKSYQRTPFKNIESSSPTTIKGGWVAYQDGHFVTSWVMPEDLTTRVDKAYAQEDKKGVIDQIFGASASAGVQQLAPGKSYSIQSTLYSGPAESSRLTNLAPGLKLTVDYGFFWLLSNMLSTLMSWIHQLGLSWGWSLVFLTVALRCVFFKQAKDQMKHTKAMEKAKPELAAIDQQFANASRMDQKRSEAVMAVYRKHKINPASACLMPLLHLPLYLATYNMVLASVYFRSQGLLWINDLSMPDPYFIMPVLAGFGLFVQTSATVDDPVIKNVMRITPFIFMFVTFKAPACVSVYVAVQMWIQALQNKLVRTT